MQRNDKSQNLSLRKPCTLITIHTPPGSNSIVNSKTSCVAHEYRRNHQKLPAAKRHVPGRYRETHWIAALLSFSSREWTHHSFPRHSGQTCLSHGTAFGAVLYRSSRQRKFQEPAPID